MDSADFLPPSSYPMRVADDYTPARLICQALYIIDKCKTMVCANRRKCSKSGRQEVKSGNAKLCKGGLFTVKPVEADTFICAYAPTAPVCYASEHRHGDYLITIQGEGRLVDADGAENEFETGLGRICNDGSFQLALLRSKFGKLTDVRVNCKFAKGNGEAWMKSQKIAANEEILVCHSHDLSCWRTIFSNQQLERVKEALRSCRPTPQNAEGAIARLSI